MARRSRRKGSWYTVRRVVSWTNDGTMMTAGLAGGRPINHGLQCGNLRLYAPRVQDTPSVKPYSRSESRYAPIRLRTPETRLRCVRSVRAPALPREIILLRFFYIFFIATLIYTKLNHIIMVFERNEPKLLRVDPWKIKNVILLCSSDALSSKVQRYKMGT